MRTVLAMDARAALIKGIELTVFPRLPRLEKNFDLSRVGTSKTPLAAAGSDEFIVEKEYLRLGPQVLLGIETKEAGLKADLVIHSDDFGLAEVLKTALIDGQGSTPSITLKASEGAQGPLRLIFRVPKIVHPEAESKALRNQLLVVLHVIRDHLRGHPEGRNPD